MGVNVSVAPYVDVYDNCSVKSLIKTYQHSMSSRYPVYKSLHTEICSMDRHKTSRLPGNQSREAKHVTCTVIGVVFPYTEPSNGNCEVRAAALSRPPSAGVCYNTQATLTIYLSLRLTARINVNLPVPVCDGVTARSSNNEQCLAQVSEQASSYLGCSSTANESST